MKDNKTLISLGSSSKALEENKQLFDQKCTRFLQLTQKKFLLTTKLKLKAFESTLDYMIGCSSECDILNQSKQDYVFIKEKLTAMKNNTDSEMCHNPGQLGVISKNHMMSWNPNHSCSLPYEIWCEIVRLLKTTGEDYIYLRL